MAEALFDPTDAEVERAPRRAPSAKPPAHPGAGGTEVDGRVGGDRPSTSQASGPAVGAGPLVITVVGKPAPQGSKRHVGNGRMIEQSARVKPWREAVKQAAFAGRTAHPFFGPVSVEIAFCFDKPKSAPKTRRTWPTTRSSGDVDKLLRATFDALTDAAVWRDDSQVVTVLAHKYFTDDSNAPLDIPGAVIAITEVTA